MQPQICSFLTAKEGPRSLETPSATRLAAQSSSLRSCKMVSINAYAAASCWIRRLFKKSPAWDKQSPSMRSLSRLCNGNTPE